MDQAQENEFSGERKPLYISLGISIFLYLLFYSFEPIRHHILHENSPTPASDYFYLATVAILSLQMVLYVTCFRLLRKLDVDRKNLLIWSLFLAFLLSMIWPTSSSDHFQYLSHGRVFGVFHCNPYLTPYLSFYSDQLFKNLSTCWAPFPSPYGPIAVYASTLPVLVGGHHVVATLFFSKLIYFLLFATTSVIFYKESTDTRSFFLFAFNPLILFELLINAHNELLVIFLWAWGWYFLRRRPDFKNAVLVFTFCYLSVFIKFIPLILLIFMWLFLLWRLSSFQDRCRFIATTSVLSGVIFVLLYLPFWSGKQTLTFPFINISNLASSRKMFPPITTKLILPFIQNQSVSTLYVIQKVNIALFLVGFLLVLVWFLVRLGKVNEEKLFGAMSIIYLLFLLFSPNYMPWYICVGLFLWTIYHQIEGSSHRTLTSNCIFIFSILGILEYLFLR